MGVELLQSEKDWVIGHKIVDIQATPEHGIRIMMDDGKDILICLAVKPAEIAKTEINAFISPAYHVEIIAQVGIPGKVSEDEEVKKKSA